MRLLAASMLMVCLVFVGCAENATEVSAEIANASNKVEANVDGMTCSGCTGEVCAAVEGIAGVTGAHADVKTGKVSVALEDGVDTEAKMQEIETVIAGLSDGKYKVSAVVDASDSTQTPADKDDEQMQENGEEPQADATHGDTVYAASYDVKGMTCTACSNKVTQAVTAVEGVESAYVCYKSGTCSVVAADGAEVCPAKVAEAIESLGFEAAQQQ